MKKNVFLKIGLVAVIVCILTSLVVSGTFAKFVTAITEDDSARVAKFGVEVGSTNAEDVFVSAQGDSEFYTVNGGEEDVFAPGTTGKMNINYTGTPEVAVELSFDVTGSGYEGNWKVSSDESADDYYPLLFTATLKSSTGEDIVICSGKSYEEFVTNLELTTMSLEAGVDISSYELEIDWEWVFYVDEASDIADTYISGLETAPTFELGVKAVVSQIAE
jgi:hypothetical protein